MFLFRHSSKYREKISMNTIRLLVVDDEPLNLAIITELLEDENYQIETAEDGAIAWEMLQLAPESYDVILLDRMMPNMCGMELLAKIKHHQILKHCPVIFQTAKVSPEEISEGLNAGAHYYITKPYDECVLLSVIKTAVDDRLLYKKMRDSLAKNNSIMHLLRQACFEFKTIDEARSLATLLSNACPEPDKTIMGLTELMINAVEHGNLEISYQEKSRFNRQGIWLEEVNKRLSATAYENRIASVQFQSGTNGVEIIIRDQGNGFDWANYMDFDPSRVMDSHGRGIAIANKLSFSSVEYIGTGNEVRVKI